MEVSRTDQFQDSPTDDWRSSHMDAIMDLIDASRLGGDVKARAMLDSLSDDELSELFVDLSTSKD